MSSAREEILGRVRAAQRGVVTTPILGEYKKTGTLDAAERTRLFIDRLLDYDATVHRCDEAQLAATMGGILLARSKRGLLIPPGLTRSWLPSGFQFTADDSLSYEQIDQSEGVLTGCAASIAITGTIILRHSQEDGRRVITLIPDYHLCVVFEDQIVETVPEGIQRIAAFRTHPLTTISGPSATSDIELTRIKGVHGPRTLEVIVAVRTAASK